MDVVFNDTFNNISVISWRSVLMLVQEKTESTDKPNDLFKLTTSVVTGIDCIVVVYVSFHGVRYTKYIRYIHGGGLNDMTSG